jgi:hypothetical protein
MNLSSLSFLKILVGGFFGALIFWAISFFLPNGILESFESVLTLQQIGLVFGALIGAALTTITIVVRDSRNSNTGSAANFSMINGIGSMFIGKSDLRDDGSYLTTEWFCFLWLPMLPVCNYRVVKIAGRTLIPFLLGSQQFDIKEKLPVRPRDVAWGYFITITLGGVVGFGVLFFRATT